MNEESEGTAAGRALGRIKTPKKTLASRDNLDKVRSKRWADPAARERQAEKIREAARRRKEAKEAENELP